MSTSSAPTPQEVHGLLCHKHVDMALICLKSLLACSADPLQLIIHDDGSLTRDDVVRLQDGLGEISILPRIQADEQVAELLKPFPNVSAFRQTNILGLKLIDVPLLARQSRFAYCDSDVLFFRPFKGLFQLTDTAAIFMTDCQDAYSVRPWHLVGESAVRLTRLINTGLVVMRKEDFDIEFLDSFLGRNDLKHVFARMSCWAEQTCYAALAYRAGCRVWEPSQIAVITSELLCRSSDLVAGHFTGGNRHLMDPWRLHWQDNLHARPVSVRTTQSSGELTFSGYAVSRLQHRMSAIL